MAASKISALTAMPNTLVDTDVMPVADVSATTLYKLTKSLLRKHFVDSAADGVILRYDAATTDWIAATPGTSRYRTVLTTRYTGLIGGTPSIITCSTTSDFVVGMPIRYVVSGTTYWGVITAVTTNTSIAVSGPALAAAATVSAIAVGTLSMVIHERIFISGSLNTVEPNSIRDGMNRYFIWKRCPKAYLVRISATIRQKGDTTDPTVNVNINGSAVSTENTNNGLALAGCGSSFPGPYAAAVWVDNVLASINSSNYDINSGEELEIAVTIESTGFYTASGLTVHLTFVPEV